MLTLLLLIFLGLVFFFIIKFTAAVAAIIAIIAGTTTITVLACVWLGTSYHLKASGYKQNNPQETYRQLDSSLKQIVADLQEMRFELEEAESYLRDVEFLRYAREGRKTEKSKT